MRLTASVLAILLYLVALYATGESTFDSTTSGTIKSIEFSWVSSATGYVVIPTTIGTTNLRFTGKVLGFYAEPNLVDPPDNAYDATVTIDGGTFDVLRGLGADMPNDAAKFVRSTTMGILVNTPINLVVQNAGNVKSGTFTLFFE